MGTKKKTTKEKDLVIGKRYFLDDLKNVSGVFTGEINGSIYFNKIENNTGYLQHDDGSIGFNNEDYNYFET